MTKNELNGIFSLIDYFLAKGKKFDDLPLGIEKPEEILSTAKILLDEYENRYKVKDANNSPFLLPFQVIFFLLSRSVG